MIMEVAWSWGKSARAQLVGHLSGPVSACDPDTEVGGSIAPLAPAPGYGPASELT